MLSWIFSGRRSGACSRNLKIGPCPRARSARSPTYLGARAEQVVDKRCTVGPAGTRFMEHAGADALDLDTLDVRETFRDHVFGCFIDDAHGIASIKEIGEDNIMRETDYPHSDSTWPNCISGGQEPHQPPAGGGDAVQAPARQSPERLYRFILAQPGRQSRHDKRVDGRGGQRACCLTGRAPW